MRTVPGPPEGVRWPPPVHEGVALEGDACTVCNRSLLSGPLWVAALEATCSCTIAHLNQGAGYCARRPPLARLAAVPLAAVPLAAASGAAAVGRPCSHAKAHQGRVANGPPRRPCSARVVWLLPHPIEPPLARRAAVPLAAASRTAAAGRPSSDAQAHQGGLRWVDCCCIRAFARTKWSKPHLLSLHLYKSGS